MFNLSIIYQIWMNKYTSADELLCLCIAQRELVSFSLTEVLLQKQHITSTILALIIQISIIWTSHIYFWLVTGSGYLILGKWTDKSYGNPIVYLTTHKIPLWNVYFRQPFFILRLKWGYTDWWVRSKENTQALSGKAVRAIGS